MASISTTGTKLPVCVSVPTEIKKSRASKRRFECRYNLYKNIDTQNTVHSVTHKAMAKNVHVINEYKESYNSSMT